MWHEFFSWTVQRGSLQSFFSFLNWFQRKGVSHNTASSCCYLYSWKGADVWAHYQSEMVSSVSFEYCLSHKIHNSVRLNQIKCVCTLQFSQVVFKYLLKPSRFDLMYFAKWAISGKRICETKNKKLCTFLSTLTIMCSYEKEEIYS